MVQIQDAESIHRNKGIPMTKLFPFQKEGVQLIDEFDGRALLSDEMGLGKSIQVLRWLVKRKDTALPAIIVCPASIKWIWESQAVQHVGMRSFICNSRKPPNIRGIISKAPLTIINYEILQYWMDYLRRLDAQTLILDEAHYVKNRRAKRTKACKTLAKDFPHLIGVSGTPLTNRPSELFPIINMIQPKLFPAFFPFAMRYCGMKRNYWGWDYSGATRLKELHQKLIDNMMIRRRKVDVLKELPRKARYVIPLDIKKRKEYEKASTDFLSWLSKKSASKAKRAARAESITKMSYLRRLSVELKMPYVFEWIDTYLESSDSKLVIFGIHKKILKMVSERYPNSVVITGSTPQKKRKLRVQKFQRDESVRIFIGNIKSAGVGISLTASDTVAFIELDWEPGNHTQAEDRIARIGQKRRPNVYYLISKDTIEEHLCRIIQKKQRTLDKILDGKNVRKEEQFDIYKRLSKKLRKASK